MPQFVIQAKDHGDEQALQRRLDARKAHLARMLEEKKKGVFITGGAFLNNNNQMIGSLIIVSLPDEDSVRNWIQQDPYITARVWDDVQVTLFRIAEI